MSLAVLPLQHDYLVVSLSSLRTRTRTLIDIRIVQGLEGVLVAEEEFDGGVVTEASIDGEMVEDM